MSDYISREKLAKKATHYEIAGFKTAKVVLLKDVMELPAADVRPVVRGKWIRGNESATSPVKDSYTCSVCGDKAVAGYFGNPVRTNYCPNCGCEMEDIEWEE